MPQSFDSLGALLAKGSAEVVALCTPPQTHRALALEAIRAGKHVFMEKPPTTCEAEIRDVVAAAKATGLCLLAGSHHPYRENVTHLRDLIGKGELGTIYAVDCFKLRRAATPVDTGRERRPEGVAFFSSVHRLDVVLYLLGMPRVRSVSARAWNHFSLEAARREGLEEPSGNKEDSFLATVHFEDGCTLTLRDFHAAHMEEPNFMQCWFGDLTIFGTRSGARLHPLTVYRTRDGGGQDQWQPDVDNDLHTGHLPAYRYLFRCLESGERPSEPGARAIAVMRLIDALYRSAAQDGREVVLAQTE